MDISFAPQTIRINSWDDWRTLNRVLDGCAGGRIVLGDPADYIERF
jgi:hypothetical protein